MGTLREIFGKAENLPDGTHCGYLLRPQTAPAADTVGHEPAIESGTSDGARKGWDHRGHHMADTAPAGPQVSSDHADFVKQHQEAFGSYPGTDLTKPLEPSNKRWKWASGKVTGEAAAQKVKAKFEKQGYLVEAEPHSYEGDDIVYIVTLYKQRRAPTPQGQQVQASHESQADDLFRRIAGWIVLDDQKYSRFIAESTAELSGLNVVREECVFEARRPIKSSPGQHHLWSDEDEQKHPRDHGKFAHVQGGAATSQTPRHGVHDVPSLPVSQPNKPSGDLRGSQQPATASSKELPDGANARLGQDTSSVVRSKRASDTPDLDAKIREYQEAMKHPAPRVTNDDFVNGSWDRMEAGLYSEAVAEKHAKGLWGIEDREYGIREHSPGKWQVVSKPKGSIEPVKPQEPVAPIEKPAEPQVVAKVPEVTPEVPERAPTATEKYPVRTPAKVARAWVAEHVSNRKGDSPLAAYLPEKMAQLVADARCKLDESIRMDNAGVTRHGDDGPVVRWSEGDISVALHELGHAIAYPGRGEDGKFGTSVVNPLEFRPMVDRGIEEYKRFNPTVGTEDYRGCLYLDEGRANEFWADIVGTYCNPRRYLMLRASLPETHTALQEMLGKSPCDIKTSPLLDEFLRDVALKGHLHKKVDLAKYGLTRETYDQVADLVALGTMPMKKTKSYSGTPKYAKNEVATLPERVRRAEEILAAGAPKPGFAPTAAVADQPPKPQSPPRLERDERGAYKPIKTPKGGELTIASQFTEEQAQKALDVFHAMPTAFQPKSSGIYFDAGKRGARANDQAIIVGPDDLDNPDTLRHEFTHVWAHENQPIVDEVGRLGMLGTVHAFTKGKENAKYDVNNEQLTQAVDAYIIGEWDDFSAKERRMLEPILDRVSGKPSMWDRKPDPVVKFPAKDHIEAENRLLESKVFKEVDLQGVPQAESNAIMGEMLRAKAVFPQFDGRILKVNAKPRTGSVSTAKGIFMDPDDICGQDRVAAEMKNRLDLFNDNSERYGWNRSPEAMEGYNERARLHAEYEKGNYLGWNTNHTCWIGSTHFSNTARHEMGHCLHDQFSKEISEVTGFDYHQERDDAMFKPAHHDKDAAWAVFQNKSKQVASKYAITDRAKDTFAEAMAENFAAYLAGFDDKVHPDLKQLFDRLSREGNKRG